MPTSKVHSSKTIRRVRTVASFALLGAVVGGTFFGWLPAMGIVGVHEVGAVVGAGLGLVANAKHLV